MQQLFLCTIEDLIPPGYNCNANAFFNLLCGICGCTSWLKLIRFFKLLLTSYLHGKRTHTRAYTFSSHPNFSWGKTNAKYLASASSVQPYFIPIIVHRSPFTPIKYWEFCLAAVLWHCIDLCVLGAKCFRFVIVTVVGAALFNPILICQFILFLFGVFPLDFNLHGFRIHIASYLAVAKCSMRYLEQHSKYNN